MPNALVTRRAQRVVVLRLLVASRVARTNVALYARCVRARVTLAAISIVATSSCATVMSECAGAFFQVAGEICMRAVCASICDDDGVEASAEGAVDDEAPRAPPRDPPPPAWQPSDGGCDERRDDDGALHVSCPDGTRALFADAIDPRVLVETTDAGDDDPCASGVVTLQGLDVDVDGDIDPTEVVGRTVACDQEGRAPTLFGHLAILAPSDVERLAGRRAISGALIIKSGALRELRLPGLRSVGATLLVDAPDVLERLDLSSLSSVGADLVIARSRALRGLSLPSIRRVGGAVLIHDNPQLAQRSAEEVVFALTRAGFHGPVDVGNNGP